MNRIITWGIFITIIGIIVFGMIASSKKNSDYTKVVESMNNVASNDWVTGNSSSTVTLVEYSDFQCPACALYFQIVERILKENSSNMRFVYRNFPLPQHSNAIPAAKAAGAAGVQGKFWEMYGMIFDTHSEWENSTNTKEIFLGYAEKIGLRIDKYNADFDSDLVRNKIDLDLEGGQRAGIDSTPTFYLNGKKISPRSYEEFKKLIEDAINTKN